MNEPYSPAFKELIYTKLDIHRKEFLAINNIGMDEIICLKHGNDDIMTSFRFKNNDFIWTLLKKEFSECISGSPKQAEDAMVQSGNVDTIVKCALLIAGAMDYQALYMASWSNG